QAMRQTGSAFKPFVYATAIDSGLTAATLLLDAPVSYTDASTGEIYAPTNYDETYEGWVTVRHALEKSRNIPAIRMGEQVGLSKVADMARRLGLSGELPPYLSLALGSAEASLTEMVSAYSAFANQGIRMRPYFVEKVTDRDGNLLEETRPAAASAIRADTAYVMTNMLRGVIQRGTAARAARLGRPLAGKTGTTNDYTDAWFIGFEPNLIAGVWVGFDQEKSMRKGEEGARAALPAWIEFMAEVLKDRPVQDFPIPSNIVFVPIDRLTGYPSPGASPNTLLEAFISGTEPTGYP
ncbi:MAG: penicillin-binding protein, partial [Acidobacteria bacterium]|nr:penicillin-binding protein [Acidobacteriota bacterium]